MTAPPNDRLPPSAGRAHEALIESPFLHAPEGARSVFVVTLAAAMLPLLSGFVLFGWRAIVVTVLCVLTCGVAERLYYRVTQTPALLGRTHAYLTAVLLALTLPAFVPWYVPVLASVFAIVVGKAMFGGVGHFLWQPALVGRLAVAVLFPVIAAPYPADPPYWPVLSRSRIVVGDIREFASPPPARAQEWAKTIPPAGKDAYLVRQPDLSLPDLTRSKDSPYRVLITYPFPSPEPAGVAASGPAPVAQAPAAPVPGARELISDSAMALRGLPSILDMLLGRRGGGIGETCSLAILGAGLYLIYRNYVKWQLPFAFLAAAMAVVAFTPIYLASPQGGAVAAMPMSVEGPEPGVAYLAYHLWGGELMLAAFLLATEMTSRPVTTG
ncbi:MAG: RnfABCDGE type electron transport complex subunit D, partial [Planctomycetota bacterium]|nr:RnfABCDGE type electron transport complex subunit D [Planctomycetota bacterium]